MLNSEQSVQAPTLTVTPEKALVDERVDIRLSGLAANQPVTIRARTKDGSMQQWEAHATFVADMHGNIEVGTQRPISGTYDNVDAMGLFWSMTLANKKEKAFFAKNKATIMQVTITAEVDGKTVASASIERLFAIPGVTKKVVEEQGLVGVLFQPAVPGPHPCVVILNGSDGGLRESSAALLASRGYTALALAYFGVEDVPKNLVNIPLEYFETAIHWLQARPEVIADKIAVAGLSRGGELALLLGATFPEIKAVVAGSPSGLIYAGISNNMNFSKPAWTYRGVPLPFLASRLNFFDWLGSFGKFIMRKPMTFKTGFLKSLRNPAAVEKATIAVEKINGPVLLISGQDDQLWPSTMFGEMVIERLKKHKHAYHYKHLSYEGAGHFVCFPYGLPAMPPMISLSPGGGVLIEFGGSAKANAFAAADAWRQILAFLSDWSSPDALSI